MTNRLEARIADLRAFGGRGLAPYVTAGDGGLTTTVTMLRALESAGVVCVELGIPFSDPIADGPVLQAASQRALAAGTTFEGILDLLAAFRAGGGRVPIVLMTYANPLLRHGFAESCRRIAAAGGDGLLVADLPVEEGEEFGAAAHEAGLAPIFFTSPTTSDERARRAARASRGFLYAIGRFGVTGESTVLDETAQDFLARMRAIAHEEDVALAVGFGIGSAAAVTAATRHADLAIVGSALVDHVHRSAGNAGEATTAFIKELTRGLGVPHP